MLRKGVVEHIGAIMLVVISAAAIGGTMSSIQSHTVEPSQQGLMDQLQAYNQEATIEKEEQFRGLVVWNMMAAQQCEYAPLLYQWDEEYDLDEDDLDFHMVENVDSIQDLDDREFTYYVAEDVLSEVIDETDFSGNCMGATPISMPMPEIVETALGYASLAAFWNWFEDETALAEWEGHSAQGRFGAADFTSEKTFRIDKEELMSFNIGGDLASSGSVRGNNAPDFVRAERAAVFQPEGVLRDEEDERRWGDVWGCTDCAGDREDKKYAQSIPFLGESPADGFDGGAETRGARIYQYEEGDDVGWREAMNAFRIRMVDVPTVLGVGFDAEGISDYDKWRDQYREVVQHSTYIICEGSSGLVQSNAGRDIEESGKEYSDDNPIYRDVVYPKIELRNNEDDCIDDAIAKNNYDGIGNLLRQHLEDDYPRSESPNNYNPSINAMEDDGKYEVAETQMRLGEDSYMPVYRTFTRKEAGSFGIDHWWDKEDNLYLLEWGIDSDECPENDQVYDITKLYTGDEQTWDGNNLNLDENNGPRHYIDRFAEGAKYKIKFSVDMQDQDAGLVDFRFHEKFDDTNKVWSGGMINGNTNGFVKTDFRGEDQVLEDQENVNSLDGDYTLTYEDKDNPVISIFKGDETGTPLVRSNYQGDPPEILRTSIRISDNHNSDGNVELSVNEFKVIGYPVGCS